MFSVFPGGHTALHNLSLLRHFSPSRLPQVLVTTSYMRVPTTALTAEHALLQIPSLHCSSLDFPLSAPTAHHQIKISAPFPQRQLVVMLLIPWPRGLGFSLNISPTRKSLEYFPCTLSLFIDLHITSGVLCFFFFFFLAITFRTVEPNKHLLNGLTMYP